MPGFRHGFRVNFIVFRGDWNCFISAIPSVILELTAQATIATVELTKRDLAHHARAAAARGIS